MAETAHFRLYSEGSEAEQRSRAAVLEDYHALLVQMTGRSPPAGAPRLDVYLVQQLADASPWRPLRPDIAGFYRADAGRISAVGLDRPQGRPTDLSGQQILLHEYAHHFMLGSGRMAYPAWYLEGFAEYFSTAQFHPDRIEYGQISANRATWLAKGSWMPLDQLLGRNPATAKGAEAAMYYAQSWLLTHYLFRQPGMRDRLIAYLKATAAGADPVQAFRTHVDPDLPGFQQRLRRYLASGATYSSFPRPAQSAAASVTPLPSVAQGLLLKLVALEHGVPADEGPRALAEVRALVGAVPKDMLAERTLALAELQFGSAETAAAHLDNLLQSAPSDPDLLRWRAAAARARKTAAGREEAQAWLERAVKAAPDDWRALHAYARLFRPVAGPLPPGALNALLRAHELAPQVNELVLDTALALAHVGRVQDAATVLEPLAWAPHGGPASDLAQRMMLKARAGDKAGVLAEVAAVRQQLAERAAVAVVQAR